MAFDSHANLAHSSVAVAPSPGLSGTTLTLAAGEGARFPAANFPIIIYPTGSAPLATVTEIGYCTSRTGDVLTFTRTAEAGGINRDIQVGDIVVAAITKKTITDIEAATGGGGGAVTFSAGTSSGPLGSVVFSNANGVTFGLSGSTITGSVQTNYAGTGFSTVTTAGSNLVGTHNTAGLTLGVPAWLTAAGGGGLTNVNVSAGTTSQNLSNVVFSNSNGMSFGLNGSTITGSYTVPSIVGLISAINASAGTTSNNLTNLVFSNAGNVSFGMNGSTITATATVASTQGSINISAGTTSNLSSNFIFSNANGFSFGMNANTITGSYTVPTVTNSAWTVSDNGTSGTVARLAFTNLNGITLSLSTGAGGSHTIVGSHNALTSQSNQAFSAAGGSSAFQTLGFSDNAHLSWSNSNGSVVAQPIKASLFAVSNTTQGTSGTQFLSALSFNGAGNVSVGVSNGSIVISGGTAAPSPVNFSAGTTSNNLGSVVFSDSNRVSFGLNGSTITAKYALNFSAGTTSNNISDQIIFADANNVSFGLNGSTITASAGGGGVTISSYEPFPAIGVTTRTVNLGSNSDCVAFQVPQAISASFMRFALTMQTNSTTLATTAATLSASVAIYSTWNAVVYSLGTGASSKSLLSVASGSGGVTQMNSISVAANGTQYSVTQAMTYEQEGSQVNTSSSYAASQTNYSFVTTGLWTRFTGARWLDIEFANSLSAGPYWLVFGGTTSSATNSTGISAASNCNVRYASHYGVTQINTMPLIMGQTNNQSGGLYGAGVFSTGGGGGTTDSLPISAITSNGSNLRIYFQLLRSA